jgi:hypothetical protein
MKKPLLASFVILLALASGLSHAQTPAPTPTFTVSAGNVTMSSSGAYIPVTLTSVNGFAGQLMLSCTPPNPAPGVNEPNCGYFGGPAVPPIQLTANGTATGGVSLSPNKPLPTHQTSSLARPTHGTTLAFSLAAILLFGVGLRRKKAHLLLSSLLLTGFVSINGCGGEPTLTPGTYTYTISAYTVTDPGSTTPTLTVTATSVVTVPSGIKITSNPAPL